jgi:hypothetical protein
MMMPDRKESKDSNFWSFILSIVFGIMLVGSAVIFYYMGVDFENRMGPFEFIVISLAVFRMTRLLVYDSITLWVRDMFLIKHCEWQSVEKLCVIKREIPKDGFKRKMAELFACPWCIGTWVALGMLFIHYLHPISWWFILGVAIAGLSTFIQIVMNLIGWNAEGKKHGLNVLQAEQEGFD